MELLHYGTPKHSGRYPYGSGKRPYQSDKKVFISGSSKTQIKDSGYYRKKVPKPVRKLLNKYMDTKVSFIIGDAPGIDTQIQDYLKSKKYNDVTVYSTVKGTRYNANNWNEKYVDASEYEENSKEWLAKKDIEMTKDATEGLAIVLDEGSRATRNNVERLIQNNKDVKVYELSKNGKRYDKWL